MALTAIGTAASLAQLLHLVRASINICKTVRDAPEELQRVATRYRLLQAETEFFAQVFRNPRNHIVLSDEQADTFKSFIENAGVALSNIENAFAQEIRPTPSPQSWNARLQYALQGKKKINLLLKELARIETSVSMFLQIVRFQLHCSQINSLHQCQNTQNNHAVEPILKRTKSTLSSIDSSQKHSKPEIEDAEIPQSGPQSEHTHVDSLAQNSNITSASGEALQTKPTNVMDQVTAFNQNPDLDQMKALFVAPYSQIMLASRIGDAALMLQIINEQNGIQYSHTTGNLTPLCLAAESGNIAAVQTLLHHGVGVNSIFGTRCSMSLCAALTCRQLEVTRLLICRGASYTHRNINGWSPLFYIWMKEEVQAPATELLQLLSRFSDFALLHKDVYDIYGWGVMHRAAAYGTAEDVAMLISFGLDPLQNMKPITKEENESCYHEWSVLHIAVCYGRLETCRVLLPYYEAVHRADTPNSQGWTLLHLAIEQGHLDIAKLLIEYGADVNAQTELTLSGKPDDTTGYEYTPLLLAQEVGPDYYQKVFEMIQNTTVKSQSNTPAEISQSLVISMKIT